MQETLMGADKEWIYSFSTWDYLLPGGTQLTSDWRASLCQQSAELAPYTGRQIASLCLLSPSVSATSWLPSPSSAGHRTQTNSHSAGEITWSLTCLSFSLLILVFNVHAHCANFHPTQNVCTAGLFFAGGKKLTHVQPAQYLWETRHPQSAATAKPVWALVPTAPKQHAQSLLCEQLSLPRQTCSAHTRLRNLSLFPTSNAVGSTHLQLFPAEGREI